MNTNHPYRTDSLVGAEPTLLRWLRAAERVGTSLPVLVVLILTLLLVPGARGQSSAPPQEGVNSGGYNIHQSVEFGGHIADFSGSGALWSTFVNLQSGPRLLEHTLEMRSLEHTGTLFDELFLTSFGYGGDPNNSTRLRMSKAKWYNFNARFRRDRNFWDYNLLANPLNPATSVPAVPIDFSPHRFEVVRRFSDFNLILAPQSRFRVRLGYGANVSEGPSLSSFHEGTDVLVFQNWRNTLHSYQIGVDFKFLPRTNISYDQFIHRYKGDTNWSDTFQTFQLSNGTPVDLGVIFNTAANQPCATPVTDFTTTPQTANATCNGYLVYDRFGRVRTTYPTEQLSFQSSYFPNLDLSGRFVYSGSDATMPDFSEFYQGLVTRTRQRQFAVGGPASATRVSTSADFAATLRVTDKFRIVDSFRWAHFRIPGFWNELESSLFGTSMLIPPNVFNPATCPGTPATCPQHSTSSPADIIDATFQTFLGQDTKVNTIELQYDFTSRVGARLGYRFRDRVIEQRLFLDEDLLFFPTLPNRGACAGQPLLPDGSCFVNVVDSHEEATLIDEHTLLFGFWTRPVDQFRLSFDVELLSADNVFTRISPRNQQQYKLRANFKPKDWMNFATTINILERRNNVPDIQNKQHSRSYGFSAVFLPEDKWALDLSYTYSDVFSQSNICFVANPAPPGSSPSALCGGAFLEDLSFYNNNGHFGSMGLMLKPVRRVTANLGYTVTSTTGTTLILNPLAPAGPLQINYHKPSAAVAVELAKRWTWKTAWNHYGYNEKSDPGFTAPRDVRGNVFTLALRYAF